MLVDNLVVGRLHQGGAGPNDHCIGLGFYASNFFDVLEANNRRGRRKPAFQVDDEIGSTSQDRSRRSQFTLDPEGFNQIAWRVIGKRGQAHLNSGQTGKLREGLFAQKVVPASYSFECTLDTIVVIGLIVY